MSNFLEYAKLESNRFGYKIYRGRTSDIDADVILSAILTDEIDIVILRFPSENIGQLAALHDTGIPCLLTDTLVYYNLDLTKYTSQPLQNSDLSFVVTDSSHIGAIEQLTSVIFQGYKNHYDANPLLKKEDILNGYQEWVRNYITDIDMGRISWLIKKGNQAVGFATCSFMDKECEGVLLGIAPDASGIGIYSDLIRFTAKYFKEKKFQLMKISTQTQNYAVQKVWVREGFILKQSLNTLHLNSLMSHSVYAQKIIYLPDDKVMEFVAANPLALLKNNIPEKQRGEKYFTGSTVRVVKPISPGKKYYAICSTPLVQHEAGCSKILVRVFDATNQIYVFSYYNFQER